MQKLLVVDENTTIQRVIKLAFKDENIRVVTVPRGRDPFEQIEDDRPDIVLADNGGEVAAFLKTRPELSHIPVVLLKGAFDNAGDGQDEALGCDDVLMKPLQPQTMIDRVKRLLRDRKPARIKPPVRERGEKPAPAASPQNMAAQHLRPVDPALDLAQYFDQLSAAFSRTEGGTAQALPQTGWLYPPRSSREQQLPPPSPSPRTLERAPAAAPATAAITDELVEQIAQRVLDRLGDRAVRSTATEIVSRLSRWLLLDEAEKIKTAR
jgi:CheY-like chemotaxis protein